MDQVLYKPHVVVLAKLCVQWKQTNICDMLSQHSHMVAYRERPKLESHTSGIWVGDLRVRLDVSYGHQQVALESIYKGSEDKQRDICVSFNVRDN